LVVTTLNSEMQYDVFISHASEDKESVGGGRLLMRGVELPAKRQD